MCDLAKKVVEHVRRSHPFELEIRNIEDDPSDLERYKIAIPVVTVNGKEIARYRISERQLIAALDERQDASTPRKLNSPDHITAICAGIECV